MTTDGPHPVESRIAALEADAAIRLLAARYAVAVDGRDLDTLVSQFVDDVDVGELGVGRDALRRRFDAELRQFTVSFSLLGGHSIEILDEDHAVGLVRCRFERQVGEQWIVEALELQDTYERRDGAWLFSSRKPRPLYAGDILERPTLSPGAGR